MNTVIGPKYTFPVGLLMTLFGYHNLLRRWDSYPSAVFGLSLAGFLLILILTIATFYKAAGHKR